jgi:hypothetical protein
MDLTNILASHRLEVTDLPLNGQEEQQRKTNITEEKDFYFLIYVLCMRKYCDGQKNQSWDFDGFIYFHPPSVMESGLWYTVCMYV